MTHILHFRRCSKSTVSSRQSVNAYMDKIIFCSLIDHNVIRAASRKSLFMEVEGGCVTFIGFFYISDKMLRWLTFADVCFWWNSLSLKPAFGFNLLLLGHLVLHTRCQAVPISFRKLEKVSSHELDWLKPGRLFLTVDTPCRLICPENS